MEKSPITPEQPMHIRILKFLGRIAVSAVDAVTGPLANPPQRISNDFKNKR
jgi:hypothetical protein